MKMTASPMSWYKSSSASYVILRLDESSQSRTNIGLRPCEIRNQLIGIRIGTGYPCNKVIYRLSSRRQYSFDVLEVNVGKNPSATTDQTETAYVSRETQVFILKTANEGIYSFSPHPREWCLECNYSEEDFSIALGIHDCSTVSSIIGFIRSSISAKNNPMITIQSNTNDKIENKIKSQLIKTTVSAEVESPNKNATENADANIMKENCSTKSSGNAHVRTLLPVRTNRTCSVLLTGPPGSGLSYLAAGIAKKLNIKVISTNVGVLLSRGKESSDRELKQITQCVLAMQPCIFLLEDLNFLVPRNTTSSATSSDATLDMEQGIIKVLKDFVTFVKNSDSGQGGAVDVFVIGCSTKSDLVCREIRELFSETVEIKIPCTAIERRKIVLLAARKLISGDDRKKCENLEDAKIGWVKKSKLIGEEKINYAIEINCDSDSKNNDENNNEISKEKNHIENLIIIDKNVENNSINCHSVTNTTEVLFDDETLDGISDSLIGYPSFSLFVESHKILKNLLKNFKLDRNEKNDRRNIINKKEITKFNNQNIKISEVKSRKKSKIHLDFLFLHGHAKVKKSLTENLLWPNTLSQLYRTLSPHHTSFGGGILLYGPPGTGKTLLPGICASSLGCPILNLQLIDVVKGEIGTGEKAVVKIFNDAKRSAPCIVFIDEFQSIFTSRVGSDSSNVGYTLSSTLANCFDDVQVWNAAAGNDSLIHVLAATNEPWAVDKSFLRPGRFKFQIFVGPFDFQGCVEFLTESIKEFNIENRPILTLIEEDFEDNLRINETDNIDVDFNHDKIHCRVEKNMNRLSSNEEKTNSEGCIEVELKESEEKEIDDNDILLIEKVAGLCVGYTGAEMKLVMKKTIIAYMDEREKKKTVIVDDDDNNNDKIFDFEKSKNFAERIEESQNGNVHNDMINVEKDIRERLNSNKLMSKKQDYKNNKIQALSEKISIKDKKDPGLKFRHFEIALSVVRPSVSQADIDEYEIWAAEKI